MPVGKKQTNELSPKKHQALREELRDAYNNDTGDILPTTEYRASGHFGILAGKLGISDSTVINFFYKDTRKFQFRTTMAIEKYIEDVKQAQLKRESEIKSRVKKDEMSEELKAFAKRIYIELKTRKAGIPVDENNDVIEEIYDSWYKLFNVIRDEIKALPAECLNDIDNPDSPVGIAMSILNDVLRPHLTEYQAKFRDWLKKAKANPKNKNTSPLELQRRYPKYGSLNESLKETNISLMQITDKFKNLWKLI